MVGLKKRIEAFDSYLYVEVFKVTEVRNGCVYRTKSVGYAHRDRPKEEGEIYSSLPTSLIRKGSFDLTLMWDK